MRPEEAKVIADVLSDARLAPYREACGGDLMRALRLYAWNKEVSGAFFGPVQEFEVVLRNAMDRRLSAHFGRRDWWSSPRIRLSDRSRRKITNASTPSDGCPLPTPDDIVSRLTLGFWESLLGRTSNYESHLWWPALQWAFPRYSGSRGLLHQDVYHLCRLRNRIAHCEPIHARRLEKDNETLFKVLGYISPEAAECIERFSRIREALDRKEGVLGGALPPRF
ncbi:hypothetical protein ACQP2K_39645 [Microbispora siamensis]